MMRRHVRARPAVRLTTNLRTYAQLAAPDSRQRELQATRRPAGLSAVSQRAESAIIGFLSLGTLRALIAGDIGVVLGGRRAFCIAKRGFAA